MEEVILVDENDTEIGTMEKMLAHREARLHRAFSVFIFNAQKKMLLQQRNPLKYHSGGLWTNTCCGHPRPGENTRSAAERRLNEEMGIKAPLEEKFSFIYKAPFSNGLTENEFDHVFVGRFDSDPLINPEEVSDFKYMYLEEIKADIAKDPGKYTFWFKICMDKITEEIILG